MLDRANNNRLWLWIPGSRFARPRMTTGKAQFGCAENLFS